MHVLGMPPAFVLSQNQTLKLMYDPIGWNIPIGPASPGAVPAQIYKLVCLRMRTFASSTTARRGESHIKERHKFTDRPEPGGSRRPGRRPHVPSSKPTMSKSRTRLFSRFLWIRVSVCRLREARNGGEPERSTAAAVRGHIWGVSRAVNAFFGKARGQLPFSADIRRSCAHFERKSGAQALWI